ncbi:MAG: PorP/SprF family type IX secretion system membrane protein [Odoribacter sp.]
MDRKVVLILFLLLMAELGFSQNSVLKFTDYTVARPLINPAAMGLESGANGLILYRSRFEKAEYWPSTGAFNINSLLENKNFGGGLTVIFDKYGPYQKMLAYLAGSYRLKVNENKWLYFGLQAGINYVTNSGNYRLHDEETVFSDNYSQPNFGFGLHFKAENYYVGVSVPELRYNTIDENGDRVSEMISEMMKIYLYGGFTFKIAQNTALIPYLNLTYCEYEDMQLDLGAKLRLKEAFEFGVQYRTKESFAASVRVKLLDELWLGYSFEGSNSSVDNKFNSTQEIGLTFHFGKKGKKSSSSEERMDDNINSIRYF